MDSAITINDVLNAYALGYFPMADSAGAEEFHWYDPERRGQLPIESLHVPRRLRETLLKYPFEIRVDTAFAAVIDGCAASTEKRPRTWISRPIRDLFVALHEAGHAHSVECWKDDELAGGVYGLALGGAFCGESMFSRARDASKVALVHLCARLWKGGFTVLDAQFMNDHLRRFGAYEISREDYRARLRAALAHPADFNLSGSSGITEKALIDQYLAYNRN